MEKYNWDEYKNPHGRTLEYYNSYFSLEPFNLHITYILGFLYHLKNGEVYFDPSGICSPSDEYVVEKFAVNTR